MKLQFIGSGNAFTLANWQSNMVMTFDDNSRVLFDCGSDCRHGLKELGIAPSDIDGVYISHLHGDHVGGLEWLGFTRFFSGRGFAKPELVISEALQGDLWNNCLKGGMASLQQRVASLETYFDVSTFSVNKPFVLYGLKTQLVQSVHIYNGYGIVPSFGLMIQDSFRKVFITADCQFAPDQMKDFWNEADVIFQDAEIASYESGVHAHYTKLITLPAEIKKKMFLYHIADAAMDTDVRADGFAGICRKGQEFDFTLDDETLFGTE